VNAESAGARRLRAILREPLLHFALGGALLFLAYEHYAPRPPPAASRDIVITDANIAALRSELVQLYHRQPSEAELNELIQDHIDTEVLYREALALGLDTGDIVVRRRMEQKMRFLIEGTTRLPDATDAELDAWLESHRADYDEPERVRLSHVFVSRDLHGDETEALAAKLRAGLVAHGDTPEAATRTGDSFPGGFDFDLLTQRELVRYFGADFAAAVMSLPQASWSQPIASPHGLHVVWVREHVPGRRVSLDELRDHVRYAFDEDRHRQSNETRLAELRARYTIEMPRTSIAGEP
jgi:parvulin-like peptidyl-prolyl isomerase